MGPIDIFIHFLSIQCLKILNFFQNTFFIHFKKNFLIANKWEHTRSRKFHRFHKRIHFRLSKLQFHSNSGSIVDEDVWKSASFNFRYIYHSFISYIRRKQFRLINIICNQNRCNNRLIIWIFLNQTILQRNSYYDNSIFVLFDVNFCCISNFSFYVGGRQLLFKYQSELVFSFCKLGKFSPLLPSSSTDCNG